MPAFMTLDNGVLTIASVDNEERDEYRMRVTMSTPDSGDQVYDTVTITLKVCLITEIAAPSDVTTLDLHYLIFSIDDLSINL